MRVHEREGIVTAAEIDLRTRISEWSSKYPQLTSAEYIKVLIGVCHDWTLSLLKIEIRIERHRNADKPGGAE